MNGRVSRARRGETVAGAAAILLAAFWVYLPALRGGWLWDDDLEVMGNAVLRAADGWWRPWVAPAGMDYFPLKSTVQWVEWHLWSGHVTGYHLANLALHGLSALLVWRLLSRLLGPGGGVGAWFAGLIFAVHPVAVESVAWISEFKNVLSLPPLLWATIAWVELDEGGPGWTPAARRHYLVALLGFLLAMLSKTSVVMFPGVLLLHAWWKRNRLGAKDLLRTLPFFAISAGLGLVTVWFQNHWAIGVGGPMPAFGLRVAQAGWSALAYLRASLWPSGLAAIYLPAGGGWPAVVPWLALAALFAVLWRWRGSWGRPALLGLGWFFLNLVPVLGLVPMSYLRTSPRADHFAYLPLVGLAGLAGAAWVAAERQPRAGRRWAAAVGLALGLVLATCAHHYAAVFRSSETLWTATVARSPGAWLACNNLGQERLREGRLAEARSLFEEAARDGPASAEVQANLGSVDERLGRLAEARGHYEAALRLDPGFGGAHYNLGTLLLSAGEPARAADEFRAALQSNPGSAKVHNNFGVALARQGRAEAALDEYRAALRLDPRLADAWVNLGNALLRLDRTGEAVAAYRAALSIAPDNVAARHNLTAALERPERP